MEATSRSLLCSQTPLHLCEDIEVHQGRKNISFSGRESEDNKRDIVATRALLRKRVLRIDMCSPFPPPYILDDEEHGVCIFFFCSHPTPSKCVYAVANALADFNVCPRSCAEKRSLWPWSRVTHSKERRTPGLGSSPESRSDKALRVPTIRMVWGGNSLVPAVLCGHGGTACYHSQVPSLHAPWLQKLQSFSATEGF